MTGKLIGKRIGALILSVILCCGCMLMFAGCSSETYKPTEKAPTVSTPTIGKEGVLRVGVDANSSPFAGTTSSSGIVGINVDIAAALADDLGLKLEIVDYGSDPAKAISSGNVDIVMGVDETNSTYDFWTSDAYIESAVALFSDNSSDKIPTGTGTKIAAQTSSMSAWEVNKQFGEDSLVSSESLKAAYADLESGTVDFVAADAIIGSFAAYQDGIDVSIIGLLQKPSGYSVGVDDRNTELKQAISTSLSKLKDDGTIELIEKKWLGAPIDLDSIELSPSAKAATNTNQGTEEEVPTDDATATEGEGTGTDTGTDAGTDTNEEGTSADQGEIADEINEATPNDTIATE